MVTLGKLVMILDLARQGLTVAAIARRTAHDCKTICKYIARGLEPPASSRAAVVHGSVCCLVMGRRVA